MKVKTLICALTITFLSTATNGVAATAGREDVSLLSSWVFLGVCGLITLLQIIKGKS